MTGRDRPWYREWFGDAYAALYPHRDEEEARRAVALLRRLGPAEPGTRVLDLACGGGRHLPPLRSAGWRPTGMDLSRELLARARRRTAGAVPLVRGDMRRLPLSDGAFGLVAQFFTSFGYFDDPGDDLRVLREVRRVLRPGGHHFLDFLHADHVRRTLVPEDVVEVGGRTVRQVRTLEDGAVSKRIEIEPGGEGPARVYRERVRLYEPGELEAMMEEVGLPVVERRGDYGGAPFGEDSPRLLLLGRAA
jgi:SAM-dependent methyltransferase